MQNTIENNLEMWDRKYRWTEEGDQWQGQAAYSGQPYEEWKASLVETFLLPHVEGRPAVLEIAPGHGRWTEILIERALRLMAVDLSPSCVEHCRKRFAGREHATFHAGDGRSLPFAEDASVDFVWSFDAFVHMDAGAVGGYLSEIRRVLKPGGRAAIHHTARRHVMLWAGFLLRFGDAGRRLYQVLSMPRDTLGSADGWRSNLSNQLFARLAAMAGLTLESQTDRWGPGDEHRVFASSIALLSK